VDNAVTAHVAEFTSFKASVQKVQLRNMMGVFYRG